MTRIKIIDSLRGLAAATVVVQHLVYDPIGFISDENVRSLFHIGEYGVQLFFIISGLVIPLSFFAGNYRLSLLSAFLIKRAIRLEPTYLSSIGLFALYAICRNIVFSNEHVDLPSLESFLLNVTYLAPFFDEKWILPVYWTLGIELQYYLLIATIWPFAIRLKNSNWLFLLLIAGFLGYKLTEVYFFSNWLQYFNVGIILALFLMEKVSVTQFVFFELLTLILVGIDGGQISAMIGVGAIACVIFIPDKSMGSIFQWLGRQSYSLYLVHAIVGMSTVNLAMRFVPFEFIWQKSIIVLCAFTVSIFSAQLLYVLVERPTARLSKAVKLE